ncbi:NAD(P)H-quinone oxidoreductase subunit 3, chloroplastic [Ananas comosus]|uniref:NAD(P)H-quinone oxidoreductase subunit 3, chloroplastic n=1 Tax=Ananas comosus TaxID=4615 RepID=A0A199VX24_ANACO|nr:NAD(P)H-quinone oxidoreductase subunit 3, chloroplastic [Ananas comosus]
MFLLHKYDILWAFLIISSVIPILAFVISGVLAPVSEGPEKLSTLIFVLIPIVGSVYAWRKGALEWP